MRSVPTLGLPGVLSSLALLVLLPTSLHATGYEQPYYSHSNGGYYGNGAGGGGGGGGAGGFLDWDGAGGLQYEKCISIPENMTLCKNIGYNEMRIPNLLDHDTVREITQQASSWVPLLGIRCHPDTKLFLCSLFSPVCLDRPIWPCRTLCQAVKTGCEALMLKYGFPWPEMLRCDKFPADNDLCIGLQHQNQPEEPTRDDQTCAACKQPDTYEAVIDNFCSSDFVVRADVEDQLVSDSHLKLALSRKKKKLKEGSLTRRESRALAVYVDGGRDCDCPQLATPQGGATSPYLVMGSRQDGRLVASYLIQLDLSKRDLKRAWKAINKADLCRDGLPHLPIAPVDTDKPKKDRKKNRKSDPDLLEGGSPTGDLTPGQEAGKKRRKVCKNPKKCMQTGDNTGTPTASRRQQGDRENRRSKRRKNKRRNQQRD